MAAVEKLRDHARVEHVALSAVETGLQDPSAPPQTDRLVRAIDRWSLAGLMLNTIVGSAIFGLPALIAAHAEYEKVK